MSQGVKRKFTIVPTAGTGFLMRQAIVQAIAESDAAHRVPIGLINPWMVIIVLQHQ
ncbi:hypothetical protein [Dickeya chrysanthemi]|uniref:hypothetical protein n=1 Tax=Dickeya chrysanthemi TaxID=556 RepID=UPI0013779A1B|nr:hypothetical protein [Dickeya chrysanthemi]MBX9447790.1 hypothetical protein [Dickeya chrysanthemi]